MNLQPVRLPIHPEMGEPKNTETLGAEEHEDCFDLMLLNDYLPDNGVDLSPQKFKEPDFPKFMELPVELRLVIWHLVNDIPGRRFYFCPLKKRWWDRNPIDMNKLCGPPNPIGLQINKESREETLRRFSKLFIHPNGFTRYFDPKQDEVIIRFLFPAPLRLPTRIRSSFQNMGNQNWQGASTLQYLELREFEWCNDAAFRRIWPPLADFRGIGRCFRGLIKLKIYPQVFWDTHDYNDFENPKVLRKCYEFFDREFARASEKFQDEGYKVPEIIIVGFPKPGSN